MARFRTLLRVVLAIVVWWTVLYPALAVVGAFLLPPDPFTQILVFGPGFAITVVAAIIFVYQSGSLRQLARFAVATFVVTLVVGYPINAMFQLFGGFGSLVEVGSAVVAIVVSYSTGYYLIYENWYRRLKARYVDSNPLG